MDLPEKSRLDVLLEIIDLPSDIITYEIFPFELRDEDIEEIIYHISNDGGFFLDDFNGLVYSDLLVIGSSSFSMSAGLFNKGIVICNEELFKCTDPIPTQWIDNYNKILK